MGSQWQDLPSATRLAPLASAHYHFLIWNQLSSLTQEVGMETKRFSGEIHTLRYFVVSNPKFYVKSLNSSLSGVRGLKWKWFLLEGGGRSWRDKEEREEDGLCLSKSGHFKKIKIKIKSQKKKELAGVGRWSWPPIFIAAVLGLHWCNLKAYIQPRCFSL